MDLVTLTSSDRELEAKFDPGAGLRGSSLRHRGDELLHVPGGGIPLLYPWANRLAGFDYGVLGKDVALERGSPLIELDQNGLTIHGLLGKWSDWEIAQASGSSFTATLDFGAYEELLRAFPFPHTLRIEGRLDGAGLAIQTTVAADRGKPVPVSFGYHPYFRIPGAPRDQWELQLPVRERLRLDDRMIPTNAREPAGDLDGPLDERSFDDGYTSLERGRPFTATAAGRRLSVIFDEHFPYAQVYSPPGAEFICFEPMTAPTNALRSGTDLPVVQAGEQFSATWSVGVRDS